MVEKQNPPTMNTLKVAFTVLSLATLLMLSGNFVDRLRIYRELHIIQFALDFLSDESRAKPPDTARGRFWRLWFNTTLQRLGAIPLSDGSSSAALLFVGVSQERVRFKIAGLGNDRLLEIGQGFLGPVLQREDSPQQ